MFTNLRELILSMPDEITCKKYLAEQRWHGKTVCPYCHHDKCYIIEGGRRYKCADKACFKRFTVTVGTIFEASNVPLSKWFTAIYLITAHKKGISSYQVAKNIGVTQKTGWFMLHRIREVLRVKTPVTIGLTNPVEADETFIGGSITNKHNAVRKDFAANPEKYAKTVVLGMIERDGQLITKVIGSKDANEIVTTVAGNVDNKATLYTDTTNLYAKLGTSYTHHAVNHSIQEYVRGNIHTNTIEGAFGHFKRMIYGIYHQISAKHTQRYCDEFTYRYNTRKTKDAIRFVQSISSVECRLRYKFLVGAKEPVAPIALNNNINSNKGMYQIKDGEIIGHYSSFTKAAKATNIDRKSIRETCKGIRKTAGGFNWCFA